MSKILKRDLPIRNKLGIHVNPASLFVMTSSKFKSKITVYNDEIEANGKSIMGVLMLGAGKDSVITVKAQGDDAKQALDALEDLVVRRKFDEE